MKVLVTGSDGFIGSHLVEELVMSGMEVKALSLYNSFHSRGWLDTLDKKIIDSVEIVSGDIRDPFLVESISKKQDAIIHLAALIAIPYSYRSPKSYLDTNINGAINILEAARKNSIKKTLITSTSEVYGSAQKIPITEEHPLSAQSPYAATKIASDQLALSYYRSFNLPVSVIRPFNTFGPRQSLRAVIPSIILQTINNKKIEAGNLYPTRDFTYVKDICKAFIFALKKKNIDGEIINLGSQFEISIQETIQEILKISGSKKKVLKNRKRERLKTSEVNRLYSDSSKAKKLLGWQPEHKGKSGFIKNLKKTYEWFAENKNLYKDLFNENIL
jgi:dTDP-glucose 4,6-dehydratase